jgi:hypothetical protein
LFAKVESFELWNPGTWSEVFAKTISSFFLQNYDLFSLKKQLEILVLPISLKF